MLRCVELPESLVVRFQPGCDAELVWGLYLPSLQRTILILYRLGTISVCVAVPALLLRALILVIKPVHYQIPLMPCQVLVELL